MTRTLSHMEWVRPTHQSRSQETLERILDAAEAVIAEKGFEKATVSEIVRRAKSSVGAMYARFNDKDALLSCLDERFYSEAIATADVAVDPERWQGASIADIFAEVIPFLVRVYQQKAGLIRALVARGISDREFAIRGARLFQHISASLSDLLMERRDEIGHPNPALAIDLGLRMVFDTLDQTTLAADIQRTIYPLSDQELSEELIRMLLGYLGVVPGESEFDQV